MEQRTTATPTENTNKIVSVPKPSAVSEWESKAKEWLSSLPKSHTLTPTEVETWLNDNSSCVPLEFQSFSHSFRFRRFTDMLSLLRSRTLDGKYVDQIEYPFRFQRTELWRPVYSWLESLDLDDVISNQEISDWMSVNPEVYDQICAKHTRHHLLHYVKKCHIKILKRRKGKHFKPNLATHRAVEHRDLPNLSLTISTNPLTNIPKDSDLYRVKREEALRKHEILVDLERKLVGIVSPEMQLHIQ
ncbi:hypothetical protein vseg_020946 [Gypsophila vaccaria]